MSGVIIAIYIISLLAYFITFGYWILRFERTGSKKFNFMTYFPFELNAFRRNASDSYLNIGLITISFLLFISPIITFTLGSLNRYENANLYVLLVVFIAAIILFNFLLFTKLSNLKGHLILVVTFAMTVTLLIIFETIFFSNKGSLFFNSQKPYVSYIILAFNIIQLIFELVLVLNPRYKTWYKMVKVDAEVFSRPKMNYLAMLEWGTFINLVLCYIPIVVLSF